jgi:SAM-dependent methyltransferase
MAEWFEDWFASDQYLNVYKHRDESDAKKLLGLISKHIPISKENLILDAACGAGRYTKLLRKNGFKAFGFDLSLPLLKKAKQDLSELTTNNIYFRADIRSVGLKKKFDLILNVFTSFGYFESDEENFSFIHSSTNYLKNRGYFVFDYFNKCYLINNLIPVSERKIDNYYIKEKRRIEGKRVVKEIELENDGQTNQFIESVALYSANEIQNEFKSAGYKLIRRFGDYDGSEYEDQSSQRLIMMLQNEN